MDRRRELAEPEPAAGGVDPTLEQNQLPEQRAGDQVDAREIQDDAERAAVVGQGRPDLLADLADRPVVEDHPVLERDDAHCLFSMTSTRGVTGIGLYLTTAWLRRVEERPAPGRRAGVCVHDHTGRHRTMRRIDGRPQDDCNVRSAKSRRRNPGGGREERRSYSPSLSALPFALRTLQSSLLSALCNRPGDAPCPGASFPLQPTPEPRVSRGAIRRARPWARVRGETSRRRRGRGTCRRRPHSSERRRPGRPGAKVNRPRASRRGRPPGRSGRRWRRPSCRPSAGPRGAGGHEPA